MVVRSKNLVTYFRLLLKLAHTYVCTHMYVN